MWAALMTQNRVRKISADRVNNSKRASNTTKRGRSRLDVVEATISTATSPMVSLLAAALGNAPSSHIYETMASRDMECAETMLEFSSDARARMDCAWTLLDLSRRDRI